MLYTTAVLLLGSWPWKRRPMLWESLYKNKFAFCLCRTHGWQKTTPIRRCIALSTQIRGVTTTSTHRRPLFICPIFRKLIFKRNANRVCFTNVHFMSVPGQGIVFSTCLCLFLCSFAANALKSCNKLTRLTQFSSQLHKCSAYSSLSKFQIQSVSEVKKANIIS